MLRKYMKKAALAAATVIICTAAAEIMPGAVYAEENISVYVDGAKLDFDVAPRTVNDRTMVPMRAVFEALGAEVVWNGDNEIITAIKGSTKLHLTIGSDVMMKNLVPIKLDAGAMLIDGRTLVPVRAVSEALGCTVDWNAETESVIINR